MTAPSHVLITTDAVGGVWTYTLELARALRRHNVHLIIATMGTRLAESQRVAALELDNVHLHESTYKLEWMSDPWDDVAEAGEWLLELEAAYQPDVVHLNGYVHGSLSWQSPVLITGHSCVYSWYRWVKATSPPTSWNTYRQRVIEGLEGANVVAAPTEFMLSCLRKNYGFSGTGHVVYNGREPNALGARRKEPFIFSAGRLWDEAKNMKTLDRAAAKLSWPVFIAGPEASPDGERTYLANASTLGALPPPELAAWMGRASIFALPARYEPFGLTPLEAALSGCALVLGDIPSLREVWGYSALFVPPDDTDLLARAVTMLIKDPVLRKRLGRRAYRRALRFLPERMARGYLALYASALARRNIEAAA